MSGWRLKIHRKRVPKGFDKIEDTLDLFDEKMKEVGLCFWSWFCVTFFFFLYDVPVFRGRFSLF